jgi:hypothetical protein
LFPRLRSDRSSRLASPWELQHRGGAVSKPYMSKVNYDDIAETSWTLLEVIADQFGGFSLTGALSPDCTGEALGRVLGDELRLEIDQAMGPARAYWDLSWGRSLDQRWAYSDRHSANHWIQHSGRGADIGPVKVSHWVPPPTIQPSTA